jgi:hypothetical protein
MMDRRQITVGLSAALVAAGLCYVNVFMPSAFERTFDENMSHAPFAASIARRDPNLREIFLRQTERAFSKGGWRAANRALQLSLVTQLAVYADDKHINTITRATFAVLLKLQDQPLACKTYLLAGAPNHDSLDVGHEIAEVASAERSAEDNGFNRKREGVRWTEPNDQQINNVFAYLRRGPIDVLTPAELAAEANYLDGDAQLTCSGSIKEHRNLLAMRESDAAYAQRILIANTAKVDLPKALSKLCGEQKSEPACS